MICWILATRLTIRFRLVTVANENCNLNLDQEEDEDDNDEEQKIFANLMAILGDNVKD